jgi:pimeloyl-ACP methyl ester carboxylesterase
MKVSINKLHQAYDDHGVGLPVVFLHAFPLNRHMWDGEIQALLPEQRYRLIALDWRGFGESEIASSGVKPVISTMVMLADDVAGLLDHLGIEQAVICGLSMGGYAAFAFAQKYPARLRGLILASTRPGVDSSEAQANREKLAWLAESQGVSAVADLQLPRLLSAETRQHAPQVEARVRQLIDAATPHGIAAASRGMAVRTDSTPWLSQIACPTLVLAGEQDALITVQEARAYAELIPGACFVTIPRAGHLSNLERPDAFMQAVRQFLESFA